MQRRLLTNGNAFKRTDDRWGGVVWYMDEHGERKRKSFSGTTKAEVNKKMTAYIADFEKQVVESDESKKTLQDSMQNWLQVFKFPSVDLSSVGGKAGWRHHSGRYQKSAQLLDEQRLRLHHR